MDVAVACICFSPTCLLIIAAVMNISGKASREEERSYTLAKQANREEKIDNFLHDIGYYWKRYDSDKTFGAWISNMIEAYERSAHEKASFMNEAEFVDFVREFYEGE